MADIPASPISKRCAEDESALPQPTTSPMVLGCSARQQVQSPPPSSETRSDEVELFVIRIQKDFKQGSILPALNVWNRVVDRCSFRFASLRVIVKRRTFLHFGRQVAAGFYTCILGKQGHLVVYTDHWKHEGYAVNLRKASSAVLKCEKELAGNNISARNVTSCKVRVEWPFGSMFIRLPPSRVHDWGRAILEAVTNSAETAPLQQDSCYWHSPAPNFTWPPPPRVLPAPPSAQFMERGTQTESDLKETTTMRYKQLDGDKESSPLVAGVVAEDGPDVLREDLVAEGVNNVGLQSEPVESKTSHFCDISLRENNDLRTVVKEPVSQDGDLNKSEEQTQASENGDDDSLLVTGRERTPSLAEQEQHQVGEDEGKRKEEEEEQQQKEEKDEEVAASTGTLKRRVTFSDLNVIFEVPELEAAMEEEEGEEDIDMEYEGSSSSTLKIAGPAWSDTKELHGIEERRKEPIVQSALDLMRIIGQHGVMTSAPSLPADCGESAPLNDDKDEQQDKRTVEVVADDDEATAKEEEAEKPKQNITDNGEEKGDRFVSSLQMALKVQFPPQSERFDRTRGLFEHSAAASNDADEDNKQQ